jgi:hypothetical protein
MENRILSWDGCRNVRDLGQLNTQGGGTTRRGAIVRSDTPARLSPAGWSALYTHGIRTIVTLSTDGMIENELSFAPPYPDLDLTRVAIEDVTDIEFAQKYASSDLWCTPLYYKDAIRRWPGRHAAAISAIARARPGGVLFHCIRGNDRTGIIALLLLSLAGVTQEHILADYALSPDPEREGILAREKLTLREALFDAVAGLDLDEYLLRGGASPQDLDAVRQRLLG